MSDAYPHYGDQDYDNADVPFSATLITSPNSPYGAPLKEETEDEGPEVIEASSPSLSPSPPPTPHRHPRYYFEDGSIFIFLDGYMLRLHRHFFLPDDGNLIAEMLRSEECSHAHPLGLPETIRLGHLESLLGILYRHPLDKTPINIKILKEACFTAHNLRLLTQCNMLAKHIIDTDCPDEPLDEAVPKYILAVKLPQLFPPKFKDVQIDKLCCAKDAPSDSNLLELGFHEIGKVIKGANSARTGAEVQKAETYEPQPVPPRASYLIKVKNMAGYRAVKREVFD